MPDLKEIEESHRKENGELREKVKQLEEENKRLKASHIVTHNKISDEEKAEIFDVNIIDISRLYDVKFTNLENSIPVSLVKEKIEELQKENEELKEENESLQKAYDDCYCEYKHYKQFDSIPKSKVKDKIEEYDKQRIKMEKDDIGVGFTLGKEWSDLKAKIEVLQELLREEKLKW
jgi:hypothetical protein